jgi:membrane protein YqaA with SNARE-associated domain
VDALRDLVADLRAALTDLFRWVESFADKPHGATALFVFAFAESSFFPIPPDVLLIALALAKPTRACRFAAWCTVGSVLGGLFGYFIGAVLYDSVGQWLIALYGYGDKVEAFREAYAAWGAWIILLKGMTPIPYKIITITSGFAGYNFLMFVLLSFVARGMRFYLVAFLLYRYGERARAIIEERLEFWTIIALIVLVAGIIAALYLF